MRAFHGPLHDLRPGHLKGVDCVIFWAGFLKGRPALTRWRNGLQWRLSSGEVATDPLLLSPNGQQKMLGLFSDHQIRPAPSILEPREV